jgi:hypothetical protein
MLSVRDATITYPQSERQFRAIPMTTTATFHVPEEEIVPGHIEYATGKLLTASALTVYLRMAVAGGQLHHPVSIFWLNMRM